MPAAGHFGHVDSSDIAAMPCYDLNGFKGAQGLTTAHLMAIADINAAGVVNNSDLQATNVA